MRAVVIGATGTVGMALISELVSRGDEVLVLCRSQSSRSKNIPDHPLIKKVDCALDQMSELEVSGEKYDAFFHLAWEGTTGAARNDMLLQTRNIKHTIDAVELAESLGCKVFVGAGSQAEYGRVEGKLNSMTPAFPENGYGMAKLCAGQMSRTKCKQLGMKHIWVRILSVFGPYGSDGSLVTSAIHKFMNGERASFTPAEQIWDLMYCADAAKAMIELAINGKDGGIYCLGSGDARPLREYIEKMRDAIDPALEIGIGDIPYADGQVMYLCADMSEVERDTGFVPTISFEEGIRKTIEWYKKEREN